MINSDIVNDNVILYVREVAKNLEKYFIVHSKIIFLNISEKMNADKWNRVAAILCSLYSIPGKYLTDEENLYRVDAFGAMYVCKEMASALFYSHKNRLLFVNDWAIESLAKIKNREMKNGIQRNIKKRI